MADGLLLIPAYHSGEPCENGSVSTLSLAQKLTEPDDAILSALSRAGLHLEKELYFHQPSVLLQIIQLICSANAGKEKETDLLS